jgi:hypothetical protein
MGVYSTFQYVTDSLELDSLTDVLQAYYGQPVTKTATPLAIRANRKGFRTCPGHLDTTCQAFVDFHSSIAR